MIMRLAALILLFALVGKISATHSYRYPLRLFRTATPISAVEEDVPLDDEASEEDASDELQFNNIQDDDDDSEEQDEPPPFTKLFPLPQANSPGYNLPLSSMMTGLSSQAWSVPRRGPQRGPQGGNRARSAIQIYRDGDSEENSSEEEEDEEEEDDIPEWESLFPSNVPSEPLASDRPEIDASSPGAFRSAIGGSRTVYVPSRQRIQQHRHIKQNSPVLYAMAAPIYLNQNRYSQVYQRPQTSNAQIIRRQHQYAMYMPVKKQQYKPYMSIIAPQYRYY